VALDPARQQELALLVLEAARHFPDTHQFLAHSLKSRFVVPVLEEWRAADPDTSAPLRELALLTGRRDLLEEALRLDPADDQPRAALVVKLLDFVDHATHHLVESSFIGGETEAVAALRDLLEDWLAYREAPRGTFPELCASHGRTHQWSTIVYYDR
jgi:hypothetical protein